jgi:hypothetical protein
VLKEGTLRLVFSIEEGQNLYHEKNMNKKEHQSEAFQLILQKLKYTSIIVRNVRKRASEA